MTEWFASQTTTGFGAYVRRRPDLSAKKTHNRLQSAEKLVWIAEALGADADLVQQVADDVLIRPCRGRCGHVREHLPWELIAEMAEDSFSE
ncbi:hypothetical protein DYI20_09280 [Auritidibacter ignavus]|nr:hypothetical protein DCC27_003950 [Auritidibacter sp. NML130574]PXA78118.1 hypothetical protein DCC26_07610 [Auritidibacter sp. NML120779]PXA81482.1 hypothetical protein DCC25_02765 [Auritidibacter sp. NML120636]RMX22588.1 hypothetical protein DYI20_09280 [Auritidibacter ignavus]